METPVAPCRLGAAPHCDLKLNEPPNKLVLIFFYYFCIRDVTDAASSVRDELQRRLDTDALGNGQEVMRSKPVERKLPAAARLTITDHFSCLTVFYKTLGIIFHFFKSQCPQKVNYFCTAYCVDTVFISYKEESSSSSSSSSCPWSAAVVLLRPAGECVCVCPYVFVCVCVRTLEVPLVSPAV